MDTTFSDIVRAAKVYGGIARVVGSNELVKIAGVGLHDGGDTVIIIDGVSHQQLRMASLDASGFPLITPVDTGSVIFGTDIEKYNQRMAASSLFQPKGLVEFVAI